MSLYMFLNSPHSKSSMIRAGIITFCHTVQSGLPSLVSTQHVLYNKCSLARSQLILWNKYYLPAFQTEQLHGH